MGFWVDRLQGGFLRFRGFRVVCCLWLLLQLTSVEVVLAQLDVRMNHYMLSQQDFNPAFAGSQGLINIYTFGRQQWVGFGKGAPRSVFLNFDIPFGYRKLSQMAPGRRMQYSHGLGAHFARDEAGMLAQNAVEVCYTGRFHLRALGSLAFGLGIRVVNDKFSGEWRTVDAADSDPAIPRIKASGVNFDLSFGLFFNTERGYFGLSAQRLLGSEVRGKIADLYKGPKQMAFAREYYLVAGYDIQLPKRWSLEPSFLYRSDFVQHAANISLRATYNNLVWFGMCYRVVEGVGALVGVNLFNGLRIGYSYDYPTTGIGRFTSGSHEVVLGYSFTLERDKKPQQYKSIRYL